MTQPADFPRLVRPKKDSSTGALRSRKIAQAPFVTISREAGAKGHELAHALAAALAAQSADPALGGWRVYDREICERILRDGKLKSDMEALLAEKYRSAIEDYLIETFSGYSSQASIYYEIFKTVRSLALGGKAILLGRGAVCCTQDLVGGLHLRLVASEKTKIAVLADREGLSAQQARSRAAELDASRAKIAEVYFKKDLASPLLYNSVWNVDKTPIGAIAEFVVSWIKRESAALAS